VLRDLEASLKPASGRFGVCVMLFMKVSSIVAPKKRGFGKHPHSLDVLDREEVVVPKEVSFYETVRTLTARAACVCGM
jgi:hypothetical protein